MRAIFAIFLETSGNVLVGTYIAGIALLLIGIWGAKRDIAQARGWDKIVALANLGFAAPLAVFSMEHFFDSQSIAQLVPGFVPWHLFWTYFVGVGLLAASLSMATKIAVRWSGLLFGIMMFLFVAMMDVPGAIANRHDRFAWTLLLRELSFGSGGWLLAAATMNGSGGKTLFTIGRAVLGITAVFYGVEHFLHPLNVPGVPLEKIMPTWIPGRVEISYLTGAILVVAGASMVVAKRTRMAATYLGSWILLLVVVIYGPILIASLLDPSAGTKLEGMNYFFDTLLFGAVILALAASAGTKQSPARAASVLRG